MDFALQFVGNPYVYGGTSLTNGADCSGFVMSVFAEFGYELPRVAAAQCSASEKKSVADIEAGDLVFMVRVVLIMWLFILVMARSFTPVQRLQGSRFLTMITGLRLRLVRLWLRI